jgi:hypothetical protein
MNMNLGLNRRVQIGVAIASMTIGSVAIAGPTSEWRYISDFQPAVSKAGLASTPFQSATGLGTNFGSSEWSSNTVASSASALTLDAQTAAASGDASGGLRMRALEASIPVSNVAPVIGSPAALQLTLWNFVNNIRAQQVGDPFVQLQTSAANIDYTLNGVVAAVPLPPAAGLFGAGLAALAMGRLFARRTRTVKPRQALAAA